MDQLFSLGWSFSNKSNFQVKKSSILSIFHASTAITGLAVFRRIKLPGEKLSKSFLFYGFMFF